MTESNGKLPLHEAAWFEADSDNGAVVQIEAKHPGSTCEIWEGKRFVAQIAPDRMQA